MDKIFKFFLFHLPGRLAEKLFQYINKRNQNSPLVREYLKTKRKVEVGEYSYGGCMQPGFNIGGEVSVGRYCSIANNVHYFGANHPLGSVSTSAYFYNKKFGLDVKDVQRSKLIIGNDVWIGYGTLITMNCRVIGNGAVVGAGSVLTHDVPPYAVVAGNPARIIKYRFSEKERLDLEKSEWWNFSPNEVMKGYYCFDNIDAFCSEIKKAKQ